MMARKTTADPSPSAVRRLGVWLLVAMIVSFPMLPALSDGAAAQAKFTEEGGEASGWH